MIQTWGGPRKSWIRPLGTLVFVVILASVFSPRTADGAIIFWRGANLANVFRQISDTGILAIGMTLVIISGGIDLSVGSLLALSCTVFAAALKQPGILSSPVIAVSLAVGAAALFGLVNGIVVTGLRLQAFIVTLATMIGSRGFAKWLVSNATIPVDGPVADFIGQKTFVVTTFLVISALGLILLNGTRFGRYLVAIGGSENAARLSGIPVTWVKVRVYLLSGLVAGVAGVLYCCETHQGDPKAGISYELDAIAAAVIGGTSLAGGKGGIFGAFVGALALGILSNLLGLRNVNENMQWMLKAVIIVAAVWLQMVGSKRTE